jgi:hypothetical protein
MASSPWKTKLTIVRYHMSISSKANIAFGQFTTVIKLHCRKGLLYIVSYLLLFLADTIVWPLRSVSKLQVGHSAIEKFQNIFSEITALHKLAISACNLSDSNILKLYCFCWVLQQLPLNILKLAGQVLARSLRKLEKTNQLHSPVALHPGERAWHPLDRNQIQSTL